MVEEEVAIVQGEAIVFRGRITEDDLIAFDGCLLRVGVHQFIRWFAYGLAAIGGLISIWYIHSDGPSRVPILCLLGCLYVLFGFRLQRRWTLRRHYRLNSEKFLFSEIRLTPTIIAISNEDFQTEFGWNLLGGVVDSPAGILFYYQDRESSSFWLPARLFEGNDLRDRVLGLANENGVLVTEE